MNIFKHIFVLSLLSLCSYGALAQNTNGGVRIELRLDQVRANNISTDFGTEEATWILTPTFSDGVVGARYCYQLDADINGINYTTSPNHSTGGII